MVVRLWILHLNQLQTDFLDLEIFAFQPIKILVARQNLCATAPATTPRHSTSTRDATEVKQPRFQIQESRERAS
jgi:hypothetical protein